MGAVGKEESYGAKTKETGAHGKHKSTAVRIAGEQSDMAAVKSFEEIQIENGALTHSALACGPENSGNKPLVLCLHGFPDNARSFRFQLPAFAEAGYRAVAPTMRGYEPQSIPAEGHYDVVSLARDVANFVDRLDAEKIHLVGHDWGAIVSYAAAALYPEKFLSLTTIAVPPSARLNNAIRKVPKQLRNSWYIQFFQIPGLSDHFVERNDWALVKKLWRDWSPGFDLPDEEWRSLRSTFSAPGVKRAMLSYYRQNVPPSVILGLKKPESMGLTTVPVRTLAITGADDGCIDTRLFDHSFQEEDFPMGFRIERLAGAGHFAHQEQPDLVNDILLNWFKEK